YEGEELEDRFKEILVQIEHLREEIGKQEERINSLSHAQNIFESNIGQVMREQRDLTEKLQEEDRKLERKTDLLFETIEEGLAMEEDEFEERLAQQEQRIAEQEDALQRRTAFLLEALEEGLSEEEAEFERRLEAEEAARVFQDQQLADEIAAQISGVEGEIEAGELGREQMAELLQEALEEGIEMESERLEELEAKLQEHGLTIPESLQDELEERSGRTGIGALAEIAAENQRQVQELQEKLEDMEKHAPTIVE
ncbi:MAG: hypothetical protein SVU88_01175, partial [Candidatus Nanohaloarchaea archaeon]|nr:hypothetical protein [Candidatus Nanohaloarchaea archaeon]